MYVEKDGRLFEIRLDLLVFRTIPKNQPLGVQTFYALSLDRKKEVRENEPQN